MRPAAVAANGLARGAAGQNLSKVLKGPKSCVTRRFSFGLAAGSILKIIGSWQKGSAGAAAAD